LCSQCFDREAVRDEVRAGVVAAIGEPGGALIADETGSSRRARPVFSGNEATVRTTYGLTQH
jgi:hypothetical protein